MKLYTCCQHCEIDAGMCPDKHWYPCEVCNTIEVKDKS